MANSSPPSRYVQHRNMGDTVFYGKLAIFHRSIFENKFIWYALHWKILFYIHDLMKWIVEMKLILCFHAHADTHKCCFFLFKLIIAINMYVSSMQNMHVCNTLQEYYVFTHILTHTKVCLFRLTIAIYMYVSFMQNTHVCNTLG